SGLARLSCKTILLPSLSVRILDNQRPFSKVIDKCLLDVSRMFPPESVIQYHHFGEEKGRISTQAQLKNHGANDYRDDHCSNVLDRFSDSHVCISRLGGRSSKRHG